LYLCKTEKDTIVTKKYQRKALSNLPYKGHIPFIISPGSRNAPLTIGFASNPAFKKVTVCERSTFLH
jgi:2-succinyl-5-enolpyruvyl-6-hydroxy-3-cyclohexene-1-carboxylate synthase